MKKELLIPLIAVLIALVAAVGICNRSATVAFANDTESDSAISSIDSMAYDTKPGAWIVAGDRVYLFRAEYNANTKEWTIHQLASSKLTPNP